MAPPNRTVITDEITVKKNAKEVENNAQKGTEETAKNAVITGPIISLPPLPN